MPFKKFFSKIKNTFRRPKQKEEIKKTSKTHPKPTKNTHKMKKMLKTTANPKVKEKIIEQLIKIENLTEQDIDEISQNLNHPDPNVKNKTIQFLITHGDTKHIPQIRQTLEQHPNVSPLAENAKMFLRIMGEQETHLQKLYEKWPNASQKSELNIRELEKTGSRLHLIGGKYAGEIISRTITEHAFEAWKKAFDAGLPVEPIILKKGEPRKTVIKKNGEETLVRVFSGVIRGPTFLEFLMNKNNRIRYKHEIVKQMAQIMRELDKLKINHRHIHPGNIVIKFEQGKPKPYLIDFDRAIIEKKD